MIALVVVLLLAAPPAPSAPNGAAVAAKAAKAKGDAAMDAARPAEALKAYEEAWALKPEPALLYNRARAHQALEQYPRALELLERFSAEAPPELKARVPQLTALIEEVRRHTSLLRLKLEPPDAEVRLGDRIITVPPEGLKVNAGTAVLEVRKEGYVPQTQKITLFEDGEAGFEVSLTRATQAQAPGILAVTTSPAGANVTLDSQPRGKSPLELTLQAGAHELLLDREGFERLATQVLVEAGQRRDLVIPLVALGSTSLASVPAVSSSESGSTIFTKWYFWAGVAVVVVAGAATSIAMALTHERPPTPGSLGFTQAGLTSW